MSFRKFSRSRATWIGAALAFALLTTLVVVRTRGAAATPKVPFSDLLRDGRLVADGAPLEVIADRERWRACNLRTTSLMEANLRWGGRSGRFLGPETLATLDASAAT